MATDPDPDVYPRRRRSDSNSIINNVWRRRTSTPLVMSSLLLVVVVVVAGSCYHQTYYVSAFAFLTPLTRRIAPSTTSLSFSENDFASWYYGGTNDDNDHHHNHHHLNGHRNEDDYTMNGEEDDYDEYEVVNSAWEAHNNQHQDGRNYLYEEQQKLLVGSAVQEEETSVHHHHNGHHQHGYRTILSEASAQQTDRQRQLKDEFIPPAQDYGIHRPSQARRYTRQSTPTGAGGATSQQQRQRQQYRVGVVVEGMNGDLGSRSSSGGAPWSPLKTSDIGNWNSRKNRQRQEQRLAEEVGNFIDDGRELWSDIRAQGAYNNVDYYEVLGVKSPIREDGEVNENDVPSIDEIKQAYRKQVKLYHPDANRSPSKEKEQKENHSIEQDDRQIPWPLDQIGQNINDSADDQVAAAGDDDTDREERMRLLNEAYHVLIDPHQRELYHRRRRHQQNMKHYSDDIRSKMYNNNRKNPLDVMGTRNVGHYSSNYSFGTGNMFSAPLSSSRSSSRSPSSSPSSSFLGERPRTASQSHQQRISNNNYSGNGNGNGDGRFFLTED